MWMRVEISGDAEEYDELIKKSRKAMRLIGLVQMYKELALTAKESWKAIWAKCSGVVAPWECRHGGTE